MNRDNHYEAAFEEYLRSKQVPYVAVDEARRSLAGDGQSIKNLDFMRSFFPKSLPEKQIRTQQRLYSDSCTPVAPGQSRFLPKFSGQSGEI